MSFLLCMKDFTTIFDNFIKKSPINSFFLPHSPKILCFLACGARQRQFASLKTLWVDGPYDHAQFEKKFQRN